jgi:hypothetical protein
MKKKEKEANPSKIQEDKQYRNAQYLYQSD